MIREHLSDGTTATFNSAYRFDAAGRIDRRYDKNKPIWFSEYLQEDPSGHFRRGSPGTSPFVRRFMSADIG